MPGPEMGDAAEIRIRLLDDADRSAWDDYVRSRPQATLYHRTEWRDIVRNVFSHRTFYLCAIDGDGAVTGVLPATRLKSLMFGDYMVSSPFVNYGGAVADDEHVEARLMAELCRIAADRGVGHIEFRDTRPRGGSWGMREDKVGMTLTLPDDDEALWRALGAKVRAQVRRPGKEGARAVSGGLELLGEFYRVFARNMRDLGTPVYPRRFFEAILAAFPASARIVVVRHRDTPVAAGLLLGHRERLEIPWASSIQTYNRMGVNMLLYWEALRLAIDQGYRVFDFGRSTAGSGTHRFKRQWGATEQPLYWHYWLAEGRSMPGLTPDNPRYSAAIKVWQRLPLPVANWLGPRIVKNLP